MVISGVLLIFFVITETILAFVFSVIAQIYYKKLGIDFKSIFKGLLERLFLIIAFIHDLTSALTFFSALKLATRLKHEEEKDEHNKFNDLLSAWESCFGDDGHLLCLPIQ